MNLIARGLLHQLVTRIYLDRAADVDEVLARVPPDRRTTLVAQPTDDGFAFDIRIQGPEETVFFAV